MRRTRRAGVVIEPSSYEVSIKNNDMPISNPHVDLHVIRVFVMDMSFALAAKCTKRGEVGLVQRDGK